VRGAEVDSAADVYALGLVLLECLTGRCEYTGSDVEAIVSRLHRSPVIPEHLPADLVRLLSLMTAQAPGDRPSARHCAEILRDGQSTAVSTLPPSPPRRRALIASAAGLLGAVGVGWAILSGQTAPVSDSPDAAKPAAVQATTSVASVASSPEVTEVPAQLAAVTSAPPATQQAEAAIVPAPVPQVVQPGPAGAPAQDRPHGPDKDVKPAPPGQAKKNKP
jgi:serine/threonine protein kinase